MSSSRRSRSVLGGLLFCVLAASWGAPGGVGGASGITGGGDRSLTTAGGGHGGIGGVNPPTIAVDNPQAGSGPAPRIKKL